MKIKYLSPSSISLWDNRDLFVQIYLLWPKLPRDPQTRQMALGSSFDAFVKNELARCVYGGEAVQLGKPFHLETIFKQQVQEDQDWAWEEGGWLFLKYKDQGAFDELLVDIKGCTDLIFEKSITKEIDCNGVTVPLRGIPDCAYRHRNGKLVILDWKCNNFGGARKLSPFKNYILERPEGRTHKDILCIDDDGIRLQNQFCFSETNKKWGDQLAIYGWLLNDEQSVVQIEQILCDPEKDHQPDCRTVTYRGYVFEETQKQLKEKIKNIWLQIQSGHIYENLSREESDNKIKQMQDFVNMKLEENPILDIINGAKSDKKGWF